MVEGEASASGLDIETEHIADEVGSTEVQPIEEPFDPAEIDVVTRNTTIGLLISRLRRGVLDLTPDFQRRAGIWTEVAQSRLIESLLLRIPLPTLYAAETGEDGWVIVDGIQRLTTITRFVAPELDMSQDEPSEPLRLQGLEYLNAYEGKTFAQLPGSLQTRIEETELLVHLIRSGTPDPVKFNIFARINTGGLPLTSQELRHALVEGPARELLAELADSQDFLRATGFSARVDRMQDREMVLRFLSFRRHSFQSYRGDLDSFLRDAMTEINGLPQSALAEIREEFRLVMIASESIFGVHAFRKRNPEKLTHRQPLNKALFEVVCVSLAQLSPEERHVLSERKETVEQKIIDLMSDRSFFNAISVGTGDVSKVRIRFETIERTLRSVLG